MAVISATLSSSLLISYSAWFIMLLITSSVFFLFQLLYSSTLFGVILVNLFAKNYL